MKNASLHICTQVSGSAFKNVAVASVSAAGSSLVLNVRPCTEPSATPHVFTRRTPHSGTYCTDLQSGLSLITDDHIPTTSRTRPRQPSFAKEVATKKTAFPTSRVSMILSLWLTLLTSCAKSELAQVTDDADMRKMLLGTWITEAKVDDGQYRSITAYLADGSYTGEGTILRTNRTQRFSEAGTFLVTGGVLIVTMTNHSKTNIRVPLVNRLRIVQLNDRELVVQSEERPDLAQVTSRKVNSESPPPKIVEPNKNAEVESKRSRSSAALEKARKIKLSTVKFDGLPLAVVVTMLRDESIKRDSTGKGVKISFASDAEHLAEAKINLELQDVTLAKTLERVADSVGLELQATDTELLLVPKRPKK